MILTRIPKLNAKRYSLYFIGVHKKVQKTNIINLKDVFLGSNITLNSVEQKKYKKIYQQVKNPINTLLLHTNFKLKNHYNYNNLMSIFSKTKSDFWKFTTALNMYDKLTILINLAKLKIIYTPSYGNYLMYMYSNNEKKIAVFKMPSGFKLTTSYWLLALLGIDKYNQIKKYSPQYMKYNLRKKKITVRGVAMNPVDHHNGGRAKKKPLFLNKYNNIAKNNK